jgi:hypothetical protein
MRGSFATAGYWLAGLLLIATPVSAQWEKADPALRSWYQSLRQPDQPSMSCCGEADAYWADSFAVGPNGEYVAIITDDRVVPGRQIREVGTRVLVPNHKIKVDQGNPTGHGVIFLSPSTNEVYCYLPPGGV